jgi:hypothetical protein
MSLAISNVNPVYVAEIERANGCAGYSPYVTASFQRRDGRWTLALGGGQFVGSPSVGRGSFGCFTLAVVIRDPTFMGPDRAICTRGRPAWLR